MGGARSAVCERIVEGRRYWAQRMRGEQHDTDADEQEQGGEGQQSTKDSGPTSTREDDDEAADKCQAETIEASRHREAHSSSPSIFLPFIRS